MERNGDYSNFAEIYADHAPKKTCVYKWIERFQDDREAVEDDEGRERPTTLKIFENVDAVRNLVEKDSRLTVYQVDHTMEISFCSAHSNLHDDLGLRKLRSREVPKALRPDQLNLKS